MIGSLMVWIGASMMLSGLLLFVVKMRMSVASFHEGLLVLGFGLVTRQATHETGWFGGSFWLVVPVILLTFVAMVVRSNVSAVRSGTVVMGPDGRLRDPRSEEHGSD